MHELTTNSHRSIAKREIEEAFFRLLQGRPSDGGGFSTTRYLGIHGKWIQSELASDLGSESLAKINGFSVHQASSKVTIGDWNPSFSLFTGSAPALSRDEFLRVFARYKPESNYWSWSGQAFPKVNKFTESGQSIIIDAIDGVNIIYNSSRDVRVGCDIPWGAIGVGRNSEVLLANWSMSRIQDLLSRKYEPFGWAQIGANPEHLNFESIRFGRPINAPHLIEGMINGSVILDSGMTSQSGRNRFLWRGSRKFWEVTAD